jgi:putative oxidoreductase
MSTMVSKDYRNIFSLVGRLLLGLIFLVSAVRTAGQFQASVADLAQNHIPLAELTLAIALTAEFLGAISVVSGLWYRCGALLLILFLVPVTLLYHAFWLYEGARRDAQLVHFLKNLAILGGLTLVALDRIRTCAPDRATLERPARETDGR